MSDENEIPLDVKNDVQLAFDIFKNEKNKVNKLKLRTMLFSFVMYKFSASDINSFIENVMGDKELFSFEDVCDLINLRLQDSKERDADELFTYVVKNDDENAKMQKSSLSKMFETCNVKIAPEEIDKMVQYMLKVEENENNEEKKEENEEANKTSEGNSISRAQFKKFYCEKR